MDLRPIPGHAVARLGDALVAGDLHLGLERALARRGVRVPGLDRTVYDTLETLVRGEGVGQLVLLGDVKDGLGGGPDEAYALRQLAELATKVATTITPGNHDGLLPHLLPQATHTPASGTVLHGVGLCHGHATPAPDVLEAGIVAACHVHPAVHLVDELGTRHLERVWVRAPFDGGTLLLVPAFNPHVGGLALNGRDARVLGPLGALPGLELDRATVFTLDGIELGRLGALG